MNKPLIEDLLNGATASCKQYLSGSAAENALFPSPWSHGTFPKGDPWDRPLPTDPSKAASAQPFDGDQVLANTCRHWNSPRDLRWGRTANIYDSSGMDMYL